MLMSLSRAVALASEWVQGLERVQAVVAAPGTAPVAAGQAPGTVPVAAV